MSPEQNGDDAPNEKQNAVAVGEAEPIAKPPLNIQVGVENGRVIVVFSQPLTTFTLPPEEAYKMGGAMILHSEEAKAMLEAEASKIITP
ncbi:MAG TPA: hypothetical protein VMW50_01000 [Dehalococcoidia bacterium]|nr:hypothetical protein [Dehalococcoidia bacterium]